MKQEVALIADAHLGGPGGPAAPLLAQLEAAVEAGCRRLLFLGDLFQVWVGDPRFETREVAEAIATLRRLRGRGVRIDYIEGNRDFFLAGSPYADAFDAVGSEVALAAGGIRYLAVHGDGLDDHDRAYRFWRALSKSALSRALCRRVPRRLARRFVDSTERRLSRTNFKHKMRIPEEVVRAYGERRLAEGHDVLLVGHFHEARHWPVAGGEVRLVEAWFRSRRLEWLPGEDAMANPEERK